MPSFPRALLLSAAAATLVGALTSCGTPATDRVALSSVPSARATSAATQAPAATPTPTLTAIKATPPAVATASRSPAPARAKAPAAVLRSTAGKGGVWGLGDSVLLGSKPLFAAHGWRVDAKVGRQFSAGVPILRSYAQSGSMPRNVVVALGTNGTISPSDCRAIVNGAGPARRVFLVNNHAARSWIAGNNRKIQACAASFPKNRVIVVDWATPAAAHPGWFSGDGIHPSTSGRRGFMGVIESAVASSGL